VADHRHHIFRELGEVERDVLGFAMGNHRPDLADHLAGAQVVAADIGEDGADFIERRGFRLHDQLGGFGVAEDGPEWLVHLVGDGCGEFPQDADARRTGEHAPRLLGFVTIGHVLCHRDETWLSPQIQQLGGHADEAFFSVGQDHVLLEITQRPAACQIVADVMAGHAFHGEAQVLVGGADGGIACDLHGLFPCGFTSTITPSCCRKMLMGIGLPWNTWRKRDSDSVRSRSAARRRERATSRPTISPLCIKNHADRPRTAYL
jgi:hypothetical protein